MITNMALITREGKGSKLSISEMDGNLLYLESLATETNSISLTYTELKTLIDASALVVGQHYVITDYQTVHTIPNTSDTNTGEVEPLLVTAISKNELAPEAYSALFPDDVIYYSPTNDQTMVPGCTKGYIYRRVDTKQNNDIPFDFRQVKFRRWQISQPTWDAATTYSMKAVVKSTSDNNLWVSLQDNNLNKATYDSNYWRPFEWKNLSYVSPGSSSWGRVSGLSLAVKFTDLYQDYKMWANASDYSTAYSNKLEGNLTDLIANSNTVIFGSGFRSNLIGAGFSSNSIGSYFQNNSIGADFSTNSIGPNFKNNSIGAGFCNSSIGPNFENNNVESGFISNSIGAGFSSNIIGSNFYYNSIGSSIQFNSIGSTFQHNSIGSNFQLNSIGSNFRVNSIGSNFYYNTVSTRFKDKNLTSVSELYNKSYPHEIITAVSGYVITWYDATGTLQKTYTA